MNRKLQVAIFILSLLFCLLILIGVIYIPVLIGIVSLLILSLTIPWVVWESSKEISRELERRKKEDNKPRR